MTVEALIVRAVLGHKIEARFGSRGGFKGFFVGSEKFTSRTLNAAIRHALIVRSNIPQQKYGLPVVRYELTQKGGLQAEQVLAQFGKYASEACEHSFVRIVPGVGIFYNSSEGVWQAVVKDMVIAHAFEFAHCAELARASGHVSANCHICLVQVTTLPDDPQGGLDFCGDCGKPTCGAHRTHDTTARCIACAGETGAVLTPAEVNFVRRSKEVR